ncbi:hypothetical protein BHE74_00048332 [Ensete ventricosum]|nr:hypothetical protein BHE74_00048332 [Ensete ventricosum]RZS21792.1 hypothetical protein BHM03_00054473 [Ensete ventricosum]
MVYSHWSTSTTLLGNGSGLARRRKELWKRTRSTRCSSGSSATARCTRRRCRRQLESARSRCRCRRGCSLG